MDSPLRRPSALLAAALAVAGGMKSAAVDALALYRQMVYTPFRGGTPSRRSRMRGSPNPAGTKLMRKAASRALTTRDTRRLHLDGVDH